MPLQFNVHVPVMINSPDKNPSDIIIDSGLDITLILVRTLETLLEAPKIKKGQELYFHTKDGPVKIKVEAYVVKEMTTPLILGNNFTDQYLLSLK